MSSWIHHKHEQLSQANRVELYMRPFFQWLDRSLENLFTHGLRKVRFDCDSYPVPFNGIRLPLTKSALILAHSHIFNVLDFFQEIIHLLICGSVAQFRPLGRVRFSRFCLCFS